MSVLEKARDLGEEIRKTEEFQELERVNENVQNNPDASRIINEINSIQEQVSQMQSTGMNPTQEQVNRFNVLKEEMNTNIMIMGLIKAQENFNNFMNDINNAISEGLGTR